MAAGEASRARPTRGLGRPALPVSPRADARGRAATGTISKTGRRVCTRRPTLRARRPDRCSATRRARLGGRGVSAPQCSPLP
eukprot:2569251-Prymnesium_polylepis.1